MTRRVFFFGQGLADGDPERADILGGKGASLAAMTRAGLAVPPGFTISTECCQAFLAAAGVWPDGLEQEVRDAMGRLEQVTGRRFGDADKPLLVSVRSGAEVSMPGMMDTILNCPLPSAVAAIGENEDAGRRDRHLRRAAEPVPVSREPWAVLVACIEAVFNSWNSPRAVAYRRDRDIRHLAGTAVTVQEMFPSRVSGVVFTANPTDPSAGEMIIESAYGLGEAVVSGEVHPDSFVLDCRTLAVKRRDIRHKAHVIPAAGDTSTPDGDAPSLTDEQLGELAQLARGVEEFFGFPVDVEWGLAGGKFALLQARRIRAGQGESREQLLHALRADLRRHLDAGRGPWVLHNLSETLPHPTPLTWSVHQRFMSGAGGFGQMYRQAGFEPSEKVCRAGPVRLIGGKVYMDTAIAPELFFEDYPFAYDMDLLRWDTEAAQAPPTRPTGTLRRRMAAGRRIAAVNRRLHEIAGDLDRRLNEEVIPEFVAWCRREKQRSLSEASAEELAELWRRRERRVMDEFAPLSLLPSLISGMALAELRALLAETFWHDDGADDSDPDELAAMLAARPEPDRTLQANAGLYAIAMGQCTLDQWLADYGHRGADELDLASPRWRERPDDVLALADRLKDGQDPMALHAAHIENVAARTRELRQVMDRHGREQFDRLLDLAKRYVAFREDGKYALMLGYDLLRDVALKAGRRLELGDDVFFLTVDELCDALNGADVPADRVAERRAQYRTEARLALPRIIDAEAIDSLGRAPHYDVAESYPAHELSGGVASGPVRIVTSLAEAGDLGRGYVLVCRSTDPAWTPLFVNAAALVLECGGALSHGAVVAREMGIPAVVLPGATELLEEGQVVVVDGHRGSVGTLGGAREQGGQARAEPDDVRIAYDAAPPPVGRSERVAARVRNIALLVWGAYLLAAFVPSAGWLYQVSLAALDEVLWPLIVHLGKPATVAVVAASLAVLTMVGQRFLTDNRRLREARRRAAALTKEAAALPRQSSRRAALARTAGPVNVRLLAAAILPIALLLGPMVMTFLWFYDRVDPASWNAEPGTAVSVVANVDSTFGQPLTMSVAAPARLAGSTPASQAIEPVRSTLETLLAEMRGGPGAGERPWRDVVGSDRSREELCADLEAYLAAAPAEQGVRWEVKTPADAAGRFDVTVKAGDAPPVRLSIVTGDRFPPAPGEVAGDSTSPIRSVKIVYPAPEKTRIFWAPLAAMGNDRWDAGWLAVYLLAYLPMMFGLRWILRVG